MKTVSGKVVSMKPVNLSKAANILSNFVNSDNGASPTVCAYLRRTSVAFNELVNFKNHHKLKKRSKEEASSISNISHRNLEEYENTVLENGGVNMKDEDKLRKKENKRKTDGSLGSRENGKIAAEFEEEGDEMVKRKSEDKKKKKKKKKRKNAEVDGGEIGNLEAPERKKRRRNEGDE